MAKKLDAERIEQARHQKAKSSNREAEITLIRETIDKNRRGERKVTVIKPERKEYACQETAVKIRTAAYCRVSTQEDAQAGRFEMQVQHLDRKSTRLNSSHVSISYAVFCLKKNMKKRKRHRKTIADTTNRSRSGR